MKNTKRKSGISLIVLVITIIVMIILASSIILSLSNSGIIEKANNAKEDTNMSTLKEVAGVAAAEYELEVSKGSTTKTKKVYVEEYLEGQGLTLPEGYEVTEEGQIAEIEKISVWDGTVATSFARGTGTEEDPYIIETAQQFAYLSDITNKTNKTNNVTQGVYYKLETDIDINNLKFTTIGHLDSWFKGNFDGNNHKIYNLDLDYVDVLTAREDLTMFYCKNATIKNLIVESGNITAYDYMTIYAAVIASLEGECSVTGCINKANLTNAYGMACGIAYSYGEDIITDCKNYGTIKSGNSTEGAYQISNISCSNCEELGEAILTSE